MRERGREREREGGREGGRGRQREREGDGKYVEEERCRRTMGGEQGNHLQSPHDLLAEVSRFALLTGFSSCVAFPISCPRLALLSSAFRRHWVLVLPLPRCLTPPSLQLVCLLRSLLMHGDSWSRSSGLLLALAGVVVKELDGLGHQRLVHVRVARVTAGVPVVDASSEENGLVVPDGEEELAEVARGGEGDEQVGGIDGLKGDGEVEAALAVELELDGRRVEQVRATHVHSLVLHRLALHHHEANGVSGSRVLLGLRLSEGDEAQGAGLEDVKLELRVEQPLSARVVGLEGRALGSSSRPVRLGSRDGPGGREEAVDDEAARLEGEEHLALVQRPVLSVSLHPELVGVVALTFGCQRWVLAPVAAAVPPLAAVLRVAMPGVP
eukprot:767228-Hanusia_phi.AAC.5